MKAEIERAIKHFKCVLNDAQVVLDSGFGQGPNESSLVYDTRKRNAQLAINALEKQIPKKPINVENHYYECPCCKRDLGISDDDIFVYDEPKPQYCSNCGQALDWTNKETI